MPQRHPRRDEALAYALENPTIPYAAIGKLFGVHPPSLAVWVQRARQKNGILTVPHRKAGTPIPSQRTAPNLVSLPAPAPPKQLPPELTDMAREATKNLLSHLADPANYKGQPLKDVATALKVLTDSYELLAPMTGKTSDTAGNRPARLVEALLGSTPTSDTPEDEDAPERLPEGTALVGSGK